jgi:hypothetical protein
LAGLYVEAAEDGLGIPREAIALEETSILMDLAGARLGMAESEKLREHIPEEQVELQTWFLKITEDPEKRRMIVSSGSLSKLAELKDGPAWGLWLKSQFDEADAQVRAAAEDELRRS